jgi:hypothetical protein
MGSKHNNRIRVEGLNDLAAQLQEATMKALLERVKDNTATAQDLKLAMQIASESGLVLNPDAFPETLKDKLTGKVDPRKFMDGDADVPADSNVN